MLCFILHKTRLRGLFILAERVGFEPTSPCGLTVFKTVAIDHSATSPSRGRVADFEEMGKIVMVLSFFIHDRLIERSHGKMTHMKEMTLHDQWLVKAPVEDVFRMMTDFEKFPEHFPKVAESVQVKKRQGNNIRIMKALNLELLDMKNCYFPHPPKEP